MTIPFVMVAWAVLAAQSSPQVMQVTSNTHPSITPNSVLHLAKPSGESAFRDLLTVGVDNHMPIGFVIGAEPSICQVSFERKEGDVTVAELIAMINAQVPGYYADLHGGVINIIPKPLPEKTATFLNIRLTEFHSEPAPHNLLGANLWMFIRSVLAPDQGTGFVGGTSSAAERVPGMNMSNQTVQSILNAIVDKGSGGLWILYTSKIKLLSSETVKPYEIYGYVGAEQYLKSAMQCSD